jgi:undecaprenyl diphosphate synthase
MSHILLDSFTPEEAAVVRRLDPDRLPVHVAIIMDGNGRWAYQQGLPRVIGHRAGTESVHRVVRVASNLGIAYLTLYSFSTENWQRPHDEVTALMGLIEEQLRAEVEELHRQGVRVWHLGRTEGLPTSLRAALRDAEALTRDNTTLTLVLAINYSGRAELVDAARRLAMQATSGVLDPSSIDDACFAAALYRPRLPDPDLLIRTAGELRVSNYLLWQIAYSEFWVTPTLWPDFSTMHFLQALADYQARSRKFGGVSSPCFDND